MTPQELKGSILSLAIKGKLVPQIDDEGTAECLFQELKTEKEIGIKNNLWGKSKSLTEIKDSDILFDLPDSWRWIKIGEICSVVTKGTTPRGGNVSYADSGIGFLRAENVGGFKYLDKTNLKYIDEDTHTGFLKRSILHADDVLITIAGTLGRTAIVKDEDLPLNANQAVSIVRLVNPKMISLDYLIYALNSSEIQTYLTSQKKITAIPNLTLEIIENCLIPLPPLAEQKRIVSKIEELLPLIDRYEAAWTKLEDFNQRFPVDMQKSILQMAIQGKLFQQDPSDGTADDLLLEIHRAKQALIEEGRIPKEKPLAPIDDNEKEFDLPENWRYARVQDIASYITDYVANGSFATLKAHTKTFKEPNYALFVRTMDLSANFQGECSYIDKASYDFLEKSKLYGGELILPNIGGSIGKAFLMPDMNMPMSLAPNSIMIKFEHQVMNKYFAYVIQSPYGIHFLADTKGGTATPKFSKTDLRNMVVPVPPLNEIIRIVTKLDEILPLCERLKS